MCTRLLGSNSMVCVCDGNARCGSPEARNSKDNIKIAVDWNKKYDCVWVRIFVYVCSDVCPSGAVRSEQERMRRSSMTTLHLNKMPLESNQYRHFTLLRRVLLI